MGAGAILISALWVVAAGDARAQTAQYCNSLAASGNYQAGIDCMQRVQRQDRADMDRRTRLIVEQAMQNPDCQAKYARFRAQGGALPFDQYAYLYAATRGFTPEGIAYFQQGEARNHAAEMRSWQGVLDAEAATSRALQERNDHFGNNQFSGGLGLQGRGEYVDPGTNRPVVLQTVRPNEPSQDPATGRWYVMDGQGNYFVQGPSGHWFPMQRSR